MVIQLKPDYVEAYDNLAWVYIQRNELDVSIKYLSESIELRPNNGWAYYVRGLCYLKKEDFENALRDTEVSCEFGYKKACEAYKKYKNNINSNQ